MQMVFHFNKNLQLLFFFVDLLTENSRAVKKKIWHGKNNIISEKNSFGILIGQKKQKHFSHTVKFVSN